MRKKEEKIHISQMGRPRGRQYYPVNIMLTKEQIEYLESTENASELIRTLLDDHMIYEERKDKAKAETRLKYQAERKEKDQKLDRLYRELHEARTETSEFWDKHYYEFIENPSGPIYKADADPKLIETYENLRKRAKELEAQIKALEEA